MNEDYKNLSFFSVRKKMFWKQDYFGMLFGMGKGSVSRIETRERSETLAHKEMLSIITFLDEKNLLGDYVYERFGFRISKRFYIYGTPMEYQKYI